MKNSVKTRDDIKADMSELYEELRSGTVDQKLAGELANIAGKWLKADSLELAERIFLANHPTAREVRQITNATD